MTLRQLIISSQHQCKLGTFVLNMERKKGFFVTLKNENVQGLSLTRSRRGWSKSSFRSSLLRILRGSSVGPPNMPISRSGRIRQGAKISLPLREGPNLNESDSSNTWNDRWVH